MTKQEAVKLLKLEERGQFDWALPQTFADDFKTVTGVYPIYCFVWFYPHEGEGRIFGYPYPLTFEAKQLLAKYNSVRHTRYPIPEFPKGLSVELDIYG